MHAHQLAVGAAGLIAAAYWPRSPPAPPAQLPHCTCQCECASGASWLAVALAGAAGCLAGAALGAAGAGFVLRRLLAAVGWPLAAPVYGEPAPVGDAAPAGVYHGSHDGAAAVRERARAIRAVPWTPR